MDNNANMSLCNIYIGPDSQTYILSLLDDEYIMINSINLFSAQCRYKQKVYMNNYHNEKPKG